MSKPKPLWWCTLDDPTTCEDRQYGVVDDNDPEAYCRFCNHCDLYVNRPKVLEAV